VTKIDLNQDENRKAQNVEKASTAKRGVTLPIIDRWKDGMMTERQSSRHPRSVVIIGGVDRPPHLSIPKRVPREAARIISRPFPAQPLFMSTNAIIKIRKRGAQIPAILNRSFRGEW
jgi:hypothetical protein